tara:strand:+ start:445 stop:783 length:339 start_codon:yes stop_codon:yes gene_type:complete
MKTFQQFSEDMRELENTMKGFANTIVPQLKRTAERNKKSPKELDALRRGITSKVMTTLGKKLDVPKLIDKIPDSKQMSTMVKKGQGQMMQKLNDPKTQQKLDTIFNMVKSFK